MSTSQPEIYFSFFMFTADLRPDDSTYTKTLIKHMKVLTDMGYDGFDLHIANPSAKVDYRQEVKSYVRLKKAFNKAGLKKAKFTTNVGSTRTFDPTSPYQEQREHALAFLKSRVEITSVLGGDTIMSGPFLYPYGVFPLTDNGESIWSDALQDWIKPRYSAAQSTLEQLGKYASTKGVQLSIEPVKSWETPPPNMISEVLDFLNSLNGAPCGVTLDTAQVQMESHGPLAFKATVARALQKKQLNYVHVSAPDRGTVQDSWIPWEIMLGALIPAYTGPFLIEVFNAIPPFDSSMRMARRRYWRPGEDVREPKLPSAYDIARASLKELRKQLNP